eukprot:446841-Hanusia_phi.AAC.1
MSPLKILPDLHAGPFSTTCRHLLTLCSRRHQLTCVTRGNAASSSSCAMATPSAASMPGMLA